MQPPYTFFFDEPVLAGELSLDDGLGRRPSLGRIEREGFLVGFEVDDLVLGEPAFDLTVSDLAGNTWEPGETYAGITLATIDGDLESTTDYVTAQHVWPCQDSMLLSKDDVAGSPPLSGERSLFSDGCAVYFRLARTPGATTLAFETRTYDPRTRLKVDVRAMGAQGLATSLTIAPETMNGEVILSDHPDWPEDPDYTTEERFVSLPTKVSLPLPADGDDLIVRIDSHDRLWLDSVFTE